MTEASLAHTPGPWTIGAAGSRHFQIEAAGETIIVGARDAFCVDVNLDANARLVAAAPNLLAALRGLLAVAPENALDDDGPEQAEAWKFAAGVVAKLGLG